MNAFPWTSGRRSRQRERDDSLASFDPGARGAWTWEQPARFKALWNLQVGGLVVGTLSGHATFGRHGEARFADRGWDFRPQFPNHVHVFVPGEPEPCARFRADWLGGGRIERPGADTLLWRRESFWRPNWGIQSPEQLPLVHVQSQPALLRRRAILELEDAARTLPDLPMLLALGWYVAMRSRSTHGSE